MAGDVNAVPDVVACRRRHGKRAEHKRFHDTRGLARILHGDNIGLALTLIILSSAVRATEQVIISYQQYTVFSRVSYFCCITVAIVCSVPSNASLVGYLEITY